MSTKQKIGACMLGVPIAGAVLVAAIAIPFMATALLGIAWFGTGLALLLSEDNPEIPTGKYL